MKTTTLICATALLGLAACGGGGGGAKPQVGDAVPASATASPQAWTEYVAGMAPDDRAEPLDLGNVDPPTSETADPI